MEHAILGGILQYMWDADTYNVGGLRCSGIQNHRGRGVQMLQMLEGLRLGEILKYRKNRDTEITALGLGRAVQKYIWGMQVLEVLTPQV